MVARAADFAMVLLGLVSAALLVVYGLISAAGTANPILFWIIVVAFLVYIGWDVRRHIRAMHSHARAPNDGKL